MDHFPQLLFDFSFQNEFTFENFVTSPANTELLTLLKGESPLQDHFYFLWGQVGTGKSHLLQALCQLHENSVYLPLKTYMTHGPEILSGLENMDLLCIDDIDAVLSQPLWEEALFHLYNLIHERGHTLVVSAQQTSRNLSIALADLASRFNWGVNYCLQELSDNEKAQALQLRAKNRGIPLKEEVVKYILLRSPRDMDKLFVILDQLDAMSLSQKRKVTIPFVKELQGW